MLGWLTVFALLTVCSVVTMLLGGAAAIVPAVSASASFALLFFLCLLTRALRGRA